MGEVVGALIPLALGIAVSPVPVGAVVLILLSPKPKGAGVAFLVGWVVGIVLAVSVFALLAGLIPATDPDAPHPVVGVAKIAIGAGLLVVAGRLWRRRPLDGVEPKQPGWMRAMSTLTTARAGVLGFVLAALNPVDTLIAIGAGLVIGGSALTGGEVVTSIALFTLVGASTVAVPVVAYLAAPARMTPRLHQLHEWLVRYNVTVTIVVIIVVGVALMGKGIGDL